MKKLLALILVSVFVLCSCSAEKVEGDALEKYLEIIDGLKCGEVEVTSDATSNKANVRFKETENGCEILSVTKSGKTTYTNYFDGVNLYGGTDKLVKDETGELDSVTAKRNLIAAPDYAINPDWYDAERSGIYKTATGYKIVVVSHEPEEEYSNTPDTTLTLYLNSDMVPTKAEIVDEIFAENGRRYSFKTKLKYKSIGTEPIFQVPDIAQ